jgi:hypothetical protein
LAPGFAALRTVWLNQVWIDQFWFNQLWFNRMFARKIRVEYQKRGEKLPCPLKWLDSFAMRNFTNASVFDDTMPVSDGQIEIGTNVPLNQLREAMEDWFRRKSYLPRESKLSLEEITGVGRD